MLTNFGADAQLAGRIIVDMSFLRDKKLIQPIEPDLDVYGDLKGVPHWRVEYDLVAVVEGRNLRYEARWPANKSGKAQKIGQVSIAAAFKPGTG
jgi:hypothetical protein